MTSNTFNSLQPDLKESYSDKKDKFYRIKKMWGKKGKKATAEKDASKNPKKFMEDNKEPSIKGLKGIAF
jgi:hypothetical protein